MTKALIRTILVGLLALAALAQTVRNSPDRPVDPSEFDGVAAGKFDGVSSLSFPELDLDDLDGGAVLKDVQQVEAELKAIEGELARQKKVQADAAAHTGKAEKAREATLTALTNIATNIAEMAPAEAICKGRAPEMKSPQDRRIQADLNGAEVIASGLAGEIGGYLDIASQMVQRCEVGDGKQAREQFNRAIQAMGKLGSLDQRIQQFGTVLDKVIESERKTARDSLTAGDRELSRARSALQEAIAGSAPGSLTDDAVGSLRARIQATEKRMGSAESEFRLLLVPPQGAEWREAGRLVNSWRLRFSALKNGARNVDSTAKQSTAAESAFDDAAGYLKNAGDMLETQRKIQASCSPDAKTAIRQNVAKIRQDSEYEILLAADIPGKAQQCELRTGQCAKDAEEIRFLMKNGGIDQAKARIATAKQRGCGVADLEKELEGYTLIRDAAVYIEAMNAACRFQDAVDWAKQLPQSAKDSAIVRQAMFRSNDGLTAQKGVNAYLDAARLAAQNRNALVADQNLNNAAIEARGIACLLNQVGQVRAGLKLPVPGEDTTTVKPPAAGGTLTGQVTVTPNKRDEGAAGFYTDYRYTSKTANVERACPQGCYTTRAVLHYEFDGPPASLTPGQKFTINATGGITYTPKDSTDGFVFGSSVTVLGDADITGQGAHRGIGAYVFEPGKYEITVRPNARSIEIRLGGALTGDIAVWKYKN